MLIPRDGSTTNECDTPNSVYESQSCSIKYTLVSRTQPATVQHKFVTIDLRSSHLGAVPHPSMGVPTALPSIVPLVGSSTCIHTASPVRSNAPMSDRNGLLVK